MGSRFNDFAVRQVGVRLQSHQAHRGVAECDQCPQFQGVAHRSQNTTDNLMDCVVDDVETAFLTTLSVHQRHGGQRRHTSGFWTLGGKSGGCCRHCASNICCGVIGLNDDRVLIEGRHLHRPRYMFRLLTPVPVDLCAGAKCGAGSGFENTNTAGFVPHTVSNQLLRHQLCFSGRIAGLGLAEDQHVDDDLGALGVESAGW